MERFLICKLLETRTYNGYNENQKLINSEAFIIKCWHHTVIHIRPLCVELACSPCACMGFLWVLRFPPPWKHVHQFRSVVREGRGDAAAFIPPRGCRVTGAKSSLLDGRRLGYTLMSRQSALCSNWPVLIKRLAMICSWYTSTVVGCPLILQHGIQSVGPVFCSSWDRSPFYTDVSANCL